MERLSVKARIPAIHLKPKQLYSLIMCILLLMTFIAGGIFMNSVSAANSNLRGPAKGLVKGISGRTY